jgi:hypothetical protein
MLHVFFFFFIPLFILMHTRVNRYVRVCLMFQVHHNNSLTNFSSNSKLINYTHIWFLTLHKFIEPGCFFQSITLLFYAQTHFHDSLKKLWKIIRIVWVSHDWKTFMAFNIKSNNNNATLFMHAALTFNNV